MGIGCDRAGHVYCRVEGIGKPNQKRTLEIFMDHIKEGSRLEYAMEKAHKPMVEILKLVSAEYNSTNLKGLGDKDNPLAPINACCREPKTFLNSHRSFQRKNLPDYLSLFAFIHNPPRDPHEEIKLILTWILKMPKKLSYREMWSNTSEFEGF